MRRSLFIGLVFVLSLSGCTTATPTAAPTPSVTLTVIPSATMAPTITPIPSAFVEGRAILSGYPEMAPCSAQDIIPKGTSVSVTGTYRDFAAIEFEKDGVLKKGYLPRNTLSDIPANIPELTDARMPWKPVVDYSSWSYYSSENGGELIVSPSSDYESDNATDPTPHPVPTPLRIHFGLQAPSNVWAEVKLYGLPDNHDPWWKDTTRMDVFVNGTSYELCVRDGTTENCTADIVLSLPQDQEITLLFPDGNGKHLQVLDNEEKVVKEIDFTQYPGCIYRMVSFLKEYFILEHPWGLRALSKSRTFQSPPRHPVKLNPPG
jgi:hypothetical protein